ncbi:MAG: hypothetical protein IH995_07310 [Proteobacteria bacterium]|nr:hypothetical protein [Pseudomonadota bacterium]
MIRFTKNASYILQGLANSVFAAAIFVALPATAGPLLDLSGTDQIKFDQFALDLPKTGAANQDFLIPNFTAAPEKSNKLEFTSLNRFILSVTEQDRSEPLSVRYNVTESIDFAGRDQPELSHSNLLNSPFANFLARKLTGPFSR